MSTAPPDPPNPRPPEWAWAAARREALGEWRRLDYGPLEKAWANRSRPAGKVVAGVLSKLRLEQRHAETEIVKVWNRLLDPNIAAHAQPVRIRNGTLFVAVDNSVWLTELVRYRQREILLRLQACFGSQTIKRISFSLGG